MPDEPLFPNGCPKCGGKQLERNTSWIRCWPKDRETPCWSRRFVQGSMGTVLEPEESE